MVKMNEVSADNHTSPPDDVVTASTEVHQEANLEASTAKLPPPKNKTKFTTYPQPPIIRSYHGPTTTEIGTDAVQAGIDSSKTRCIVWIRSLSWRLKISIILSIVGLILSIIITNTCKYVIIIRTYNDENLSTAKFGGGVVKGQLEPTDKCREWFEYDDLQLRGRMDAARVGAVGCVIAGSIVLISHLRNALSRDTCKLATKCCFSSRVLKTLTVCMCLLAAGFQALVPLMVQSDLCQVEEGEGGAYLDTCSKDTRPFTLSFVVMGIYVFESIIAR